MQKTFYSSFDRTLGRTIKTSLPQYWPDGYGRDVYIAYDNAGIWKDNLKPLNRKPTFDYHKYSNFHSLKRIPPSWRYFSDGTGRDTYIVHDEGGLVKLFMPSLVYNNNCLFRSSVSPTQTSRIKFTKLSKSEIENQNYLMDVQRGVIDRLYLKAKNKILQKNKFILENRKDFEKLSRNGSHNPNNSNNKRMYKSSSCGNFPTIRISKKVD